MPMDVLSDVRKGTAEQNSILMYNVVHPAHCYKVWSTI